MNNFYDLIYKLKDIEIYGFHTKSYIFKHKDQENKQKQG